MGQAELPTLIVLAGLGWFVSFVLAYRSDVKYLIDRLKKAEAALEAADRRSADDASDPICSGR
jgi:hypothetical protein